MIFTMRPGKGKGVRVLTDYRKEWKSYRRRLWAAVAAWAVPPVLVKLAGLGGALEIALIAAWLFLFTLSMVRLYSFRCPRCHEWFFLKSLRNHPLAKNCVHCGLPKHAPSDPDQAPPEEKQAP